MAFLIMGAVASLAAHAAGVPKPVIKIENPGQCIAATEDMRVNHMNMLGHQRDRSLRQGIRGEKANLNGCINCHASKTTGSVIGKDGFCESCHTYTAVKVDCWQCHQPKAGYKAAGIKP
ncbi:MAG: hypothetical protein Q8J75_00075 [Rhodocyclaceae bacterium]|nr:hypothetical protein [Rhodocyclaceae bacterium]